MAIKVLIVDDSMVMRKIVVKSLKAAGFDVESIEAADGKDALKKVNIVLVLKLFMLMLRIFSVSTSVSTGFCTTSLWLCSGVSSSIFFSGPMKLSRLITIFSLMGSMAGLVTCANSCLK